MTILDKMSRHGRELFHHYSSDAELRPASIMHELHPMFLDERSFIQFFKGFA